MVEPVSEGPVINGAYPVYSKNKVFSRLHVKESIKKPLMSIRKGRILVCTKWKIYAGFIKWMVLTCRADLPVP